MGETLWVVSSNKQVNGFTAPRTIDYTNIGNLTADQAKLYYGKHNSNTFEAPK
jgi:hypothetical protein